MPTSRCNGRCLMCDIWRSERVSELSLEDLVPHLEALRRLGLRRVILSGGEPLLYPNIETLLARLDELSIEITLLSNGLRLQEHVQEVARTCDNVVVSLDGSREVHDAIRQVPHAYDRLAAGVATLKALAPEMCVTGRCTLQEANALDLPNAIQAAHELGLDQISFLAADISTTAFNRAEPWADERAAEVALSRQKAAAFQRIVERVIVDAATDFASGYIAERPTKLRRLPRYYAALNGNEAFPPVRCNAPWVSTVIEADGTVRPCFFHAPLGNIHERPLNEILNGPKAIAFRQQLDVRRNPVCQRCVCSLYLGAGKAG